MLIQNTSSSIGKTSQKNCSISKINGVQQHFEDENVLSVNS
jgi:hypothetical protein